MFNPVILLLSTLFIFHTSAQSCYYPNGTVESDPGFQPCSSDQSNPLHTICCATNVTSDHENLYKDHCLPNGVCQEVVKGESTRYWRELCTAKDWANGNCLNICVNDDDFHSQPQITPCNGSSTSEKWCCGDSTACCSPVDNPAAITLSPLFGVTATPTPTPTPTPKSDESHTKVTKLALGIGLGIGIPILLVLLALLWFTLVRRPGSNSQQAQKVQEENNHTKMELISPASELGDTTRQELPDHSTIATSYCPDGFETKPTAGQYPEAWVYPRPVEITRPEAPLLQEMQ